VTLRPDLILEIKGEIYIFDAKFKHERLDLGQLTGSDDEEDVTPSGTTFEKADLYKMHTYRDAIRGCRRLMCCIRMMRRGFSMLARLEA
jgi:predicted component of viral defense system (DUF524 family)